MRLIFEADEAWSMMMLIVSQVVDGVDLPDDAKVKIRTWRSAHAEGSEKMNLLAEEMNEALGNTIDDATRRLIRRKGGFVPSIQQEDA